MVSLLRVGRSSRRRRLPMGVAPVSICRGPANRESLPATAVGSLHRARCATAPDRRRNTCQPGATCKALRLARRAGGRAASDDDSMASRRLEVALANEVSARSATDPCGTARADPQDDQGERAVGRRADRQRTAAQAGDSDLATNVRKYLPKRPPGRPRGDLRWSTFLKSHARGILACDFFVAVTATFRMLYVLVVIEHGTRRLAHVNVTTRPSAAWTLQQLREVIADADRHKYLIHDRDSIFARHLDDSIWALGLRVLRSRSRAPRRTRSANGPSALSGVSAWTG